VEDSSIRTVLIVRPGALGDTILTLPLLESIAQRHPEAALTFLGNSSYGPLFPADITVQSIDSADWLWLFSNDGPPEGASTPVFDMAYVILHRSDKVTFNLRKTGTRSVRCTSSRPISMKHVVESLHEGLGLPIPPKKPALTYLAGSEGEDRIWVHAGSGGERKCAPLKLIARIAQELASSAGLGLAITMSGQDAFLKERPGWKELVNLPGAVLFEDRPLTEICSRLGSARLFIGNDSGVSHLAAGLGIPAAVMFIATDPAQWMPWAPPNSLCVLDLRDDPPSSDLLIDRVRKFFSE
jgi:ADP-heptose:LPS heptosyltransferase